MKCEKCNGLYSMKDVFKEKNKAEDMQEKVVICPHCGQPKTMKFEND